MKRAFLLPGLVLGALTLAAANAPAMGGVANGTVAKPAPVHVRVQNQNYLDVNIYAMSESGHSVRLGMVSGLSTESFKIPDHLRTEMGLRLVADPIGSSIAYISDIVAVAPGDGVDLTVGPTINFSSVSVR
ncbi:MAG: hypothetical protein HY701_14485 [Gemmatimonadetes bacterium]|nr:hypothetical protein [Gemmatimonadota bacterium]